MRRAWIEIDCLNCFAQSAMSLSMRRAWIEMAQETALIDCRRPSLSMRRAWIEMHNIAIAIKQFAVALHAESVDRNH